MKDSYVTATLELLNNGTAPDTVFSNLKKVLKERGHSSLLPSVLKALLSAYELSSKHTTALVVVADEQTATEKEVMAALSALGATSAPVVVVDASIIGGSQVIFNHKLIDQSYKTQLHNLYKAALNA